MNGLRERTITMRPGEVQRWRILHAGWQDDLFLDLEGHTPAIPAAKPNDRNALLFSAALYQPGSELHRIRFALSMCPATVAK